MLDWRIERVSCTVYVSFANYARFQVVGQQGRKVVQLDPQSHCYGDVTVCMCHHIAGFIDSQLLCHFGQRRIKSKG